MLANLNDRDLLVRTQEIVKQEREILAEVIRHLREIDRRRLYTELKYKSLFEYAVRELGYSEDQAWRRINAVRVTNQLPQLEEKIESGALTLGNLSVASTLFRAESKVGGPVTVERKLEVLQAVENKSRREAEKVVQQMALVPPESLKLERLKFISDSVEIRFTASAKLGDKMNKIKGLLAHKYPHLDIAGLLEVLCAEFLARHDKQLTGHGKEMKPIQSAILSNQVSASPAQPRKAALCDAPEAGQKPHSSAPPKPLRTSKRKHLPVSLRRQAWQRAHGRCQNCGSEHALEIDHIKPVAKGGADELANLRLLCRPCNQRAAIVKLGFAKMASHLSGSKGMARRRC